MIELYQYIGEIFWDNPYAQTLGILGFIVMTLANLEKDDKKLNYLFSVSFFIWSIHFFALGFIVASLSYIIALSRNFFALFYKQNIWVWGIFSSINILIGIIFYDGNLTSVLPVLGAITMNYAMFFHTGISLRIWLLVATIIWLVFGILSESIGAVLAELVFIGALIYNIYTHKKK